MKRKSKTCLGAGALSVIVVLTAVPLILQTNTTAQATQAGVNQVDPFWPKSLPNRWVFGSVVGLAVDSRDHVWVVHRVRLRWTRIWCHDGLSAGCASLRWRSAAKRWRDLGTLLHRGAARLGVRPGGKRRRVSGGPR